MKTFVVSAAFFALLAPAALAQAHSEVMTAETHAGLAAKATGLDDVKHHLHHALNCIAGPKGQGYDAKEMNPCANSGNGAMQDSNNETQKHALQNAMDEINAALADKDLKSAQEGASKAAALLKAAE